MEISRLTITKETKEKMNKPLSHFQKGKLRWDKLTELEKSGKLSAAKNRQEVMGMLGLGSGYGAGYSWVSNMISRGSIKEILTGFDKYNNPEYEYHVVNANKPNYKTYGKANKPKNNNKAVEGSSNNPAPIITKEPSNNIKIEITKGDISIRVELDDYAQVTELLKTLLEEK